MTTKVRAYWNLHRNTFSLQSVETGRVFEHADDVVLENASFVVRPAGRERVRRERRKNVHAFVVGDWDPLGSLYPPEEGTHVRYNPYETDGFVDAMGNQISMADKVVLRRVGQRPQIRLAE